MIKIYVRDCNGNREMWKFPSESIFISFYNNSIESLNEDIYEIQMVIYHGVCVYSGLSSRGMTFEELYGFFA